MKKMIIAVMLIISLGVSQQANSQVGVAVDFNTFYTTLTPYGRWVDYPQYGRIWVCSDAGFRPYYTDGHWEYTSDGWTWVSDYPWGWAPFHYGRWAYVDGYGWSWVPGYDWAPAWVGWCNNDDYYGWAPLAPGLSLSFTIGSIPAERWCFVPHQYINSPSIHNYYVDNSRNVTIYQNVTIINNNHSARGASFAAGPRREDVERATHTQIPVRSFSSARQAGRTTVSGNAISIYRPAIRKSSTLPATTQPAHNATTTTNRTTTRSTVHRTTITRTTQPTTNTSTNRPMRQHTQHTTQPHQQRMNNAPRQHAQQHFNNAPVHQNAPQRSAPMPHANPGGGEHQGGGGDGHDRRG